MVVMKTIDISPVRRPPVLACVLLACGCASSGERDTSPISTDRPGLLFAPTLVPSGRTQVEAGPLISLTQQSGGDSRGWSFPVALRHGLSADLELRASLPPWTETRVESGASIARDDGFGDAEVGAKLALPPLGSAPLAVLVSMRLPTGADALTTDEVGGSAFLLTGRDLDGGFWVQGMVGLSHTPIDGGADPTSAIFGGLISHAIGERTSAYVNAAAVPGLHNAPGQSFAGAGLTWTPTDRLQFDVSADFGLDEDSADVLTGFGVSWYF